MATSSFNKDFVVSDSDTIRQLEWDLKHPQKVEINERDHEADREEGVRLLKQRLLSSKTI